MMIQTSYGSDVVDGETAHNFVAVMYATGAILTFALILFIFRTREMNAGTAFVCLLS